MVDTGIEEGSSARVPPAGPISGVAAKYAVESPAKNFKTSEVQSLMELMKAIET